MRFFVAFLHFVGERVRSRWNKTSESESLNEAYVGGDSSATIGLVVVTGELAEQIFHDVGVVSTAHTTHSIATTLRYFWQFGHTPGAVN